MTFIKSVATRLLLPFRLDLRALALLRIGTGTVLLLDLFFRLPDLRAHYAGNALLPFPELFIHGWHPWHISVHTISGAWQIHLVLFGVAIFSALAIIAGWRTRLFTVLSWFLLLSLHNRNLYILQAGDDLLRLTLFWAMFLPWGNRWSLDALQTRLVTKNHRLQNNYLGAAGAGYVLLLFSVYFFSAMMKYGPEWKSEYSALYYALSLDQILLPAGKLIYPYYSLLQALTFVTWWAELLLPLLLLLPVKSYWPRLVFVAGFFFLHLGISLCLYIGLFFLIGWVSLLGLLPGPVMDKIEYRLKAIPARASWRSQQLAQAFLQRFPGRVATLHWPVWMQVLLVWAAAYCIFWNVNNLPASTVGIPQRYQWMGKLLRLDQSWGMFAPGVFKEDGWYVFAAQTTDGRLIDINRNGALVSYQKPKSVVKMFSSDRWRKYYENYSLIMYNFLRQPHCNFMMSEWNNSQQDKITSLQIIFVKELTLPNYKQAAPEQQLMCSCGAIKNSNTSKVKAEAPNQTPQQNSRSKKIIGRPVNTQ